MDNATAQRPPEGRVELPSLDEMGKYLEAVEQLPGWRRIGDILVDLGYLTPDQLLDGLKAQRRMIIRRQKSVGLLDVLQETGAITADQAREALNYQIGRCYLPALAQALGTRDQALEELRATYQRSLQTIASYEERAKSAESKATLLARRAADLEAQLARLRGDAAGR